MVNFARGKEPMLIENIYSFDIETNQYYNYDSWGMVGAINPDTLPFPTSFKILKPIIEAEFAAIVAAGYDSESCSYPAGRDSLQRVHNEFMRQCVELAGVGNPNILNIMQEVDMHFDVMTGKDGCLQVLTDRSEMYLSCMLEMRAMFDGINKHTGEVGLWYVWDHPQNEIDSYIKSAKRHYMTTVDDVSRFFNNIYRRTKAKSYGAQLVLIHNLSYEMNNCLTSTDCFKNLIENGCFTFLSNNQTNSYKSAEMNKIVTVRKEKKLRPVVYIRDTWKLTGKSIAAVGEGHGYPKLPYEYDCIRNAADLTDKDYEYNARDTELAAFAFCDAMSNFDECEELTLKSIPVSQNNIVSAISKYKFHDDYEAHKAAVTRRADDSGQYITGERYMPADVYAAYKPTTGGGLVTVNPEYAYNVWEKGKTYNISGVPLTITSIEHIDLNSAHPSQAFKREYPASTPRLVTDATMLDYVTKAIEAGMKQFSEICTPEAVAKNADCFSTCFPKLKTTTGQHYSGFATFTLKNFKARRFGNPEFRIPTMWGAKLVTKKSGVNQFSLDDMIQTTGDKIEKLQGKIVAADEIKVCLTFEDLAIMYMFNDFEISVVEKMYLYKMSFISPYLYKQFVHFGEKKSAYKKVTKMTNPKRPCIPADLQAYFDKCDYIAPSDKVAIMSAYTNNIDEGHELAESLLKIVKGQFNGIYGTAYQSLYRDSHTLTLTDSGEVLWTATADSDNGIHYDEENNSGVDVLQGSYIAQWSRIDIACYTLLSINCGCIPLYIATDSIYYLATATSKDMRPILSGSTCSQTITDGSYSYLPYNKQTAHMYNVRPNVPHLGGMDFENSISKIAYTQPLKIVYDEILDSGVKTKITFSGVPAKAFFEGWDGREYERLLGKDGYISRLSSHKTAKKENAYGAETYGYVLDSVAFVNNSTQNPYIVANMRAAYTQE